MVFHKLFKCDPMVFHNCFKVIKRIPQGCLKGVSTVFHGCFKVVHLVFWDIQRVLEIFNGRLMTSSGVNCTILYNLLWSFSIKAFPIHANVMSE